MALTRRILMVLAVSLQSAFCTLPSAYAAFEDTGTGARPTVMGGTYVAAGDDAQSLMYNPAALAQLHRHDLTSEYSKLYTGLSDGSNLGQYYLGYAQPIKYGGTIAAGIKQLSLDSLYKERTISLGYGEWITENVAAGLAFKQLHHSFEAPSISVDDSGNISNTPPSFFSKYGNSSTAYSMDLGVLYRWTARHTVGLSIQDVNEPNIALNPADHEIVPRTVRAGLSYKARRGLTLAGSVTTREGLSNQKDVTWTGAAEKWWEMRDHNAFAVRGSLATGSRSFQQFASGASYRFGPYQLDYAFVFNLTGVTLGNTAGTHRFSFSYRFGPEVKGNVRLHTAKTAKPAARPATRRHVEIEEILESDGEKESRKAGTRTAESVQAPAAKETGEVAETAEMMGKTPAVTAPTAPMRGPGLGVSVPAAIGVAAEAPLQPEDMSVPVQAIPTTAAKTIAPVSRLQVLERVDRMVHDYADRTTLRESADARLAAFTPLYPTLQGYLMSRGELLEQLDSQIRIDQSEKEYATLKWAGASAQARMRHLNQALESTLSSALQDRTWDLNDQRDRTYKAWLDEAVTRGQQMVSDGETNHARMIYWGSVAHKALEFERMPKQPIQAAPAAVPAPAPTPAAAPAPVPVQPTPVVTPTVAPVVVPATPKPAPAAAVVSPVKPVKTAPEAPKQAEIESLGGSGGIPAVYKVQPGDTLLSLAKRFYGDYNRWRDIYILNQDRLGPGGNLRPGQLLLMPKE